MWLWGTGVEHSTLYQYQFNGASDVFAGFVQTETPYYQPAPQAPAPWTPQSSINDPTFSSCAGAGATCYMAWGLRIVNSANVYLYGAGLYSFFNTYSAACSKTPAAGATACQLQIADLEGSNSNINFYALSTVSTTNMIVTGGSTMVAKQTDNVGPYNDCIAQYHN